MKTLLHQCFHPEKLAQFVDRCSRNLIGVSLQLPALISSPAITTLLYLQQSSTAALQLQLTKMISNSAVTKWPVKTRDPTPDESYSS
jgi:hypothetical protein